MPLPSPVGLLFLLLAAYALPACSAPPPASPSARAVRAISIAPRTLDSSSRYAGALVRRVRRDVQAHQLLPRLLGAIAVLFGVMTLYVPFVLWFNVLSGFAYIAAGLGLALRRRWTALLAVAIAVGIVATSLALGGHILSVAIAVGIVATSLALGGHILSGGAFERETVVAMGVRFVFWTGLSVFAHLTHNPGARPDLTRSNN